VRQLLGGTALTLRLLGEFGVARGGDELADHVGLLMPGAVSTPDDTSTPGASAARMARPTFSGVMPPASSQGRAKVRPRSNCQSKARRARRAQRVWRRLGIEQQHVGDAFERGNLREDRRRRRSKSP
jgi:hypothetical protein